MSVGFTFRVDIRPYTGFTDPALPVASWFAQGGAAGNASGGTINLDFPFQRDGDAQISELFNIEQIAADTTSAVARDAIMQALNMDFLALGRPATDRRWRLQTTAAPGAVSAISILNNQLPLWLGTPNREEGDAGLRFLFTNVDLLLYFVSIQGYMWGPRSVMAEGGPRRPLSGLFG